jgi:hypothetical protein
MKPTAQIQKEARVKMHTEIQKSLKTPNTTVKSKKSDFFIYQSTRHPENRRKNLKHRKARIPWIHSIFSLVENSKGNMGLN